MPIPIITDETIAAIWGEYGRDKSGRWGKRLDSVRNSLFATNPGLVAAIERVVGGFPKEAHDDLFRAILSVIAVLQHQAQADDLKAKFK